MTVKKAYENKEGVFIEFYTNENIYLGDLFTVDGKCYNSGEHIFEIYEIRADFENFKVTASYLKKADAPAEGSEAPITGSVKLKDLVGCYIYKYPVV